MRKPIIVGNWKMNKTIADTKAFVEAVDGKVTDSADWGIATPYLALQTAKAEAKNLLVGETDETVNAKMLQVLKNDMTPIVCVGETLEEYEAGTTKDVVKKQTVAAFKDVCPKCAARSVIAYEPVWAIGTGKTATNEIAQDVCAYIRSVVADLYDQEVADSIRIQYVGSVQPEGLKTLLEQPDIDGALVGGASLQPDSYIAMIENLG